MYLNKKKIGRISAMLMKNIPTLASVHHLQGKLIAQKESFGYDLDAKLFVIPE